ncbi:MAG: metal-dependent hydrolase [Armatimonadota bacterium]
MENVLPHGTTLTWLGHSTVRIGTPSGARILIDPWTYGNPSCPAADKDPGPLDLILITHAHDDHIGDAVRIAHDTGARVVAIGEIGHHLWRLGVSESRMVQMNRGGTVRFPDLGVSITQTVALHSSSTVVDGAIVALGEPCGYVVDIDGFAIYHAGDTDVFSDMRLIADLYAPKVALLPIGDHYTMGPEDGVRAADMLGPKVVIPCHYNTFPPIAQDEAAFAAKVEAKGIRCAPLSPGESVEV